MRFLLVSCFLFILSLGTTSCAHPIKERAQVCTFSFDLAAESFDLISKDDSSCSAFVKIGIDEAIEEVGSLIVSNDPPSKVLPRIPGNFLMNSRGRVTHKLPEEVSDDRQFYYVDSITPGKSEKRELQDRSTIEISEYNCTVTRLEHSGEETSVDQGCIDAIRYSETMTLLFAGCTARSNSTLLYDRVFKFLSTAKSSR